MLELERNGTIRTDVNDIALRFEDLQQKSVLKHFPISFFDLRGAYENL
jgi:hypothetical protein